MSWRERERKQMVFPKVYYHTYTQAQNLNSQYFLCVYTHRQTLPSIYGCAKFCHKNSFWIPVYGYLMISVRLRVLVVPVPYRGMSEENCGWFAKNSKSPEIHHLQEEVKDSAMPCPCWDTLGNRKAGSTPKELEKLWSTCGGSKWMSNSG